MYKRGISRERRFPDNMCTGIVLSGKRPVRESSGGKRPVRESSCPGNVLSGKRPYTVWLLHEYFLANSYVLEENYGLQRAAEVRSSSAVS